MRRGGEVQPYNGLQVAIEGGYSKMPTGVGEAVQIRMRKRHESKNIKEGCELV